MCLACAWCVWVGVCMSDSRRRGRSRRGPPVQGTAASEQPCRRTKKGFPLLPSTQSPRPTPHVVPNTRLDNSNAPNGEFCTHTRVRRLPRSIDNKNAEQKNSGARGGVEGVASDRTDGTSRVAGSSLGRARPRAGTGVHGGGVGVAHRGLCRLCRRCRLCRYPNRSGALASAAAR